MRQYPFAENRLNKNVFCLFLAAMLYLARDTLVTSCILGFNRSQFLMLGLMALAGLAFLVKNRRDWRELLRDRRLLLLAVFAVVLLLPMAGKGDWQMMYFSVLLCLVFAVFLTFFTTTGNVAKFYVLILTAVGIYSLVATYLLRRLPDAGIWPVPTFSNSEGVVFYNFGLSYVSVEYCKNRNFGIFREPGVYQYFIMLALVLNSYLVSWDKEWKLWTVNGILAVLMLSTLAIGGYVEMALLALVLFIDKKLYRNKYVWAAALTGLAAVVGIVYWAYVQKNMLWWEIYAMTASKLVPGADSTTDRLGSIFVNLKFFLGNPLFGAKISQVLYAIENNTSSTMLMYAIFGILGGCLHVAGWTALVWKTGRKFWVRLGLLLVLFMSFNTQNLIADVFFWLLPTMALTEGLEGRKRHG